MLFELFILPPEVPLLELLELPPEVPLLELLGNTDGIWLGAAEGFADTIILEGLLLGVAEGNADDRISLGAVEGKFVKVDVISAIPSKSMVASMPLAIKASSMAF